MFIVGILNWWYGAGWLARVSTVRERLARAFDFFSIDLLVRTWFAPFRQISAGKVSGPIDVQLRAWFDGLISRVIGGIVRTFVIIFGSIWLVSIVIIGMIELILWFVVPAFPVIGALLVAVGWVPSWQI